MFVARITAKMESPSLCASESLFKTTTPHPSPRTYPSALASNVLQYPSGDSILAWQKLMVRWGESIKFTPAANAISHFLDCKFIQAESKATSDEEHAVSIATQGP